MRDYLIASLMKRPSLLSARFDPDGYTIVLEEARAESTVERWNQAAKIAFGSFWDDEEDDYASKPFAYSNGMALIPITGVLLNRFSYSYSGATGYNAVRSQLSAALADSAVKGIIYDVDSPGGMVQGCMELSDFMYEAREQKPSVAVIDGSCCSAAYALASAAGRIVAAPSADVGSIGVRTMHIDLSGMLDQIGVAITHIYAGKHKVDGNPHQPLPAAVKKDIQKSLDATYDIFVSTVARNRNLDASIPRDTEAQIYSAAEACELDLIDAVSTPQEALTEFHSELSGSSTSFGDTAMTTKTTPGATEAATVAPVTSVAADPAALQAATVAATKAERERINSILSCEEAKERGTLAQHLAMQTDMSVDSAKGILGASPKPAAAVVTSPGAAATPNGFEKAMDTTSNPNVSAGAGDAVDKPDHVGQILKNFGDASGQSFRKNGIAA